MIKILLPTHCRGGDSVLYTQCLLKILKDSNINFQFITNINDIQLNDVVVYRFGSDFENYKYMNTKNLSKVVSNYIKTIESRGATVYPSSNLMRYYENKKMLKTLFEDKKVKTPKTFYIADLIDYQLNRSTIAKYLPVVVKHSYSCSSNGMFQSNDIDELDRLIVSNLKLSNALVIQQKIQFTREARITYYGDNIFHGYYRVKPSKEALSGASNHGSVLDFDIDLEKYKPFILNFIDKTNFTIGGIDICWENDDMDAEPYVLEVSPIFDVNPTPVEAMKTLPYSQFKQTREYQIGKQQSYFLAAKQFLKHTFDIESRKFIYCDIDNTIADSVIRMRNHPENYKIKELVINDPPIIHSISSVNELSKKYKLIFLTARKSYQDYDKTTREWLYKHGYKYHQLLFVNSAIEKINILKLKSNMFIDDLTQNHETIIKDDEKMIEALKKQNIDFIKFDKVDKNWNYIIKKIFN